MIRTTSARRNAQLFCGALCALAFAAAQVASAGTGFNLNAKGAKTITLNNKVGNSQVKFSSKAPLENIDGGTAEVAGSFVIDPANLEATTGKLSVPIVSMQTGIELRNRHLREKDWLDAESFPSITLEIKRLTGVAIVSSGGGKGLARATVEGVFSMRGVSKPLSAPVEITYMEKSPHDVVMARTEFKISLKEHGVQGRKGLIGSKVSEVISVKVTVYGSAG